MYISLDERPAEAHDGVMGASPETYSPEAAVTGLSVAGASGVPGKTVMIDAIGGAWVLQMPGRSPERFQTRLQAVTRADQIVSRMPTEWTILVKPAPSPMYR